MINCEMKMKKKILYGAAIGGGIGAVGTYLLAHKEYVDTCTGKTQAECVDPCYWVNNQCIPPIPIDVVWEVPMICIGTMIGAVAGGFIGYLLK
jgi:hypothetical protein